MRRRRAELAKPWAPLPEITAIFGEAIDRAWAAGFFDGEGTISVADTASRRGSLRAKQIKASCNQIDAEVLYRFRDAVGVGAVRGPYGKNRRRRPIYVVTVHGIERVELMYEALWPYLGSVKKEQAITKITEYRTWREEWEALLPPGNRRRPLGPTRKSLVY